MNQNDILNQVSSAAVSQQPVAAQYNAGIPSGTAMFETGVSAPIPAATDYADAVRRTALKDLAIIDNFMKSGIINPVQGQHLMNYVLNKAREVIVQQQQAGSFMPNQAAAVSGIDEFTRENPDFFKQNQRNQVLEYLRNSNAGVDKDEILRISQMIEALEQGAVQGYLQKQAHAKSLNDENEAAKQRLRANAQNPNAAENNARIFTREQIGKMSGAEFAKNERAIMEQLRKGLIR